MIRTIEELEALPEDAVVQEADTNVTIAGASLRHAKMDLPGVFPIVRLIPATISREQFEEVSDQWPYRSLRGNTLENFLAEFGIEVGDE